jgi:glycosyltransferase involved in cell wall biosynthesis
MAAALEKLMRDPDRAQRMGRAARAHVCREFSIDAEAAQIAVLYRQVRAR